MFLRAQWWGQQLCSNYSWSNKRFKTIKHDLHCLSLHHLCHTLHGKVLYILFSFFIRKVNSNDVPTKLFCGVAGQVCDIIGRQLRTCFLHIHSLSLSILSLDWTVSGFISPTPQLPVGRKCQQQPLCVLFRCIRCYSGRLKFHFFRFMGSCWVPVYSKKLCFVFRVSISQTPSQSQSLPCTRVPGGSRRGFRHNSAATRSWVQRKCQDMERVDAERQKSRARGESDYRINPYHIFQHIS